MFDKNVFQFQARSLRHNTGPCVQAQAVPFSFETTRQSLSIVVTKCSHAKQARLLFPKRMLHPAFKRGPAYKLSSF